MQWDTLAFLPHPTDIAPPPPPRPFASVRFDPLAWSSGSDQRRISGCGIKWLLAGPDSLPLWLCRVCAFVLLRCFSCSHTVLPKEHSLGIIFFSSLSSCKCCIFLQFYLHFTTDYTCMIVYVTNNKEPWTLNLVVIGGDGGGGVREKKSFDFWVKNEWYLDSPPNWFSHFPQTGKPRNDRRDS